MYQVIVVGTDGSERAAIAVQHALSLAKLCDARLHVVHVTRPVSTLGAEQFDPGLVTAVAFEAAHDERERIRGEIAAQAEERGVPAEVHVVEGHPPEMLVKSAESVGADVLVLGNRGMTGLRRLVLGSVPNKVSHHCPCSLLIVNTELA
jgi:nucleotide-binding universal stress UspA family protein